MEINSYIVRCLIFCVLKDQDLVLHIALGELLPWWRHQRETFSALLAICAGNSPVPGEFPHKDQWRGDLMFSLICVWINGSVNNREAGDLRHYRANYDVIVMTICSSKCLLPVRHQVITSNLRHHDHSFNTFIKLTKKSKLRIYCLL